MNSDKLFDLFEKIYFHEMEVREKLIFRVQINFALVATGYAIISYMVRMLDFDQDLSLVKLFVSFTVVSIILSILCLKNLVQAFWGNVYQGMPSPKEIDSYKNELEKHSAEISEYNLQYPDHAQTEINVNEQLKSYMYEKYRDCSSHNTDVNDCRGAHIHQSFKWLLISAIPFLLASGIFIGGDLDVSSPRKETLIYDKAVAEKLGNLEEEIAKIEMQFQSQVKERAMSKEKQNPPPPPPKAPAQPEPRSVLEKDKTERKL